MNTNNVISTPKESLGKTVLKISLVPWIRFIETSKYTYFRWKYGFVSLIILNNLLESESDTDHINDINDIKYSSGLSIIDEIGINKYCRRYIYNNNPSFLLISNKIINTIIKQSRIRDKDCKYTIKLLDSSKNTIFIATLKLNTFECILSSTFISEDIWPPTVMYTHEPAEFSYNPINDEKDEDEKILYIDENSNPIFTDCVCFYHFPTHVKEDGTLFVYSPRQLYNIYINHGKSIKWIREFIYLLEVARLNEICI